MSTTGMVGAVMITKDSQNPVCFATESLGSTRHRITAVDICYGKSKASPASTFSHENYYRFFNVTFTDGHYLVAVSSGSVALPVRCYRVSVRKTDDKCHITSQALPSFFLHDGVVKDNTCENLFDISCPIALEHVFLRFRY